MKLEVERWVCDVEVKVEDEEWGYWEDKWDDVREGVLRGDDVRRAGLEEVEYLNKKKIWREVSVIECWEKAGRGPLGVRWADTNKGTEEVLEVRSRLAARDFRQKADKEREDLFAATPPIEAGRPISSRAAMWVWRRDGTWGLRKLMFLDAKKAHVNP